MANSIIQVADGTVVPVNEAVSEVVQRRDAAMRDETMASYFAGDTEVAINPSLIVLAMDFKD